MLPRWMARRRLRRPHPSVASRLPSFGTALRASSESGRKTNLMFSAHQISARHSRESGNLGIHAPSPPLDPRLRGGNDKPLDAERPSSVPDEQNRIGVGGALRLSSAAMPFSANDFLQALAAGILVGGAYALMCIGLGIIFGAMRVINFAQGDFLM